MSPTLSVLVPIYNWDISRLVHIVGSEIIGNNLEEQVEICLIDDCSTDRALVATNSNAARLLTESGVHIGYVQNEKNLGRSATRNRLVGASTGLFLLFLDADVIPDDSCFITNYLEACKVGIKVACGGVSYRQCGHHESKFAFYIKYSGDVSVAPAVVRNTKPWAWVFTANMMAARDVLHDVPFDEDFNGYGYEDLEWGIRLAKQYGIDHIDNTVTHLGLLTKEALYLKLLASSSNLVHLQKLHPVTSSRLALVRIGNALSILPLSFLDRISSFCGWVFMKVNHLYPLELVMLQSAKVFLAAAMFKHTGRKGQ